MTLVLMATGVIAYLVARAAWGLATWSHARTTATPARATGSDHAARMAAVAVERAETERYLAAHRRAQRRGTPGPAGLSAHRRQAP